VLAARVNERHARRDFLERRLLSELAQQDALTWTKNRLVFDETLGRLWSQAAGAARSLAIGLIDIDYFKAYRYGHQAGDAALRRAAQAIACCARRPLDLVARYGGEEFGVILFDTDGAGAAVMPEAMRCAVQSLAIERDTSRCGEVLTISVGVAVLQPSAGRNAYGALQLADEALYQAKSKGRNRIEVRDEAEHGLLVTGEFSKDIIAMVRQGAPTG
jgi:diguanylate cyclase (GGDEF)-like protein